MAAIKFIHHHLQHVNVRVAINLIMVNVFQSVILTQFGKLALVSVLLNIHFMEVPVENVQLIQSRTKIKHPVSVTHPLKCTMQMPINVRIVLQNPPQM